MERLPKLSGIYIITNQINRKVYIGQAKGCKGMFERQRGHLKAFRRGRNSPHLQSAWDLYGADSFTFEVLLLCPPEECDHWEEHYISVFKSWLRDYGYNIKRTSEGPEACSDETRLKISIANSGKKFGPRSEEVKQRISERRKAVGNKPRTEAMNKKNGDTHRGMKHKKFSEEAKQKLSKIHTGRRWVTDGERSTQIPPNTLPPLGWVWGRKAQMK